MPKGKELRFTIPVPTSLLDRQREPEFLGAYYSPDCQNVYSQDGKIKSRSGYTTFATNTLAGVPLACDQFYLLDGTSYLMAVTTTKIYVYDRMNGDWEDITDGSLAGTIDSPVSVETMNDTLIISNWANAPRVWPGTGLTTALAGSPPKAKVMFKYHNHLLMGYTNEGVANGPQKLMWSDLSNPAQWVTGSAGYAMLDEGVDWIQAVGFIDQTAYIYKERSIVPVTYTGDASAPFDCNESKFRGIGLAAPRAKISLGGYDIFFGWDGLYRFDGFSVPQALGSERIGKWLVDNISPTYQNRGFMHYVEELGQVWFFFPTTGSAAGYCDKVLVYGITEDMFSVYSLGHQMTATGYYEVVNAPAIDSISATFDSQLQAFDSRTRSALSPLNLFLASTGQVYQTDPTAPDDAGVAIESYFWTEDFTF